MSEKTLSVVPDEPALPTHVEAGDFYRYLFLGERVAHIRAQLALAEKECAGISEELRRKYRLADGDSLDAAGAIKRI